MGLAARVGPVFCSARMNLILADMHMIVTTNISDKNAEKTTAIHYVLKVQQLTPLPKGPDTYIECTPDPTWFLYMCTSGPRHILCMYTDGRFEICYPQRPVLRDSSRDRVKFVGSILGRMRAA